MDALDDILTSLKLTGGVVFDVRSTGDWCVVSQFEPEHCAPFFPIPDEIISYHYVRQGRMFAQLPSQEAVEVNEGSLVLFPRNQAHLLFTKPGLEPRDIAEFIGPGSDGAMNSIVMDLGGASNQLYCGWLGVPSGKHPLLTALPSMMLVRCDAFIVEWISSSLRIAAREWHNNPVAVAKVSELLFAQAVRRFAESAPDGSWLAALRDPVIARALTTIHARYGDDLNLTDLAAQVGVSRSVLGERFIAALGEPPMRYCARWRMQLAANFLLDGREPSSRIAHKVGFGSEAAFSRAFKRHYGEPPATWKRRAEERVRPPVLA